MSQHKFSEVPSINVPRSMFKRPFNLKTTIGTDYLYPVYVDEALPGDTFVMKGRLFGRLSTPLTPIMDNLYLDTFFFAVPIRLLDDNFCKVMGERPFGDITTDYSTPVLNTGASGAAIGSLSDYFGIPTGVKNLEFCAYWHRAYNLIYNEWFRDENLCEPAPVGGLFSDGHTEPESLEQYPLRKRCKRHDYFTACLPWPQKGDPVGIPLGGFADVVTDGHALSFKNDPSASLSYNLYSLPGGAGSTLATKSVGSVLNPGATLGVTPRDATSASQALAYSSGLLADMSGVSAVTINALREAVAVQGLLELDARSGTRLIEIIRGHFNVVSPDARMQRPEYLGGFTSRMNVTSVPQTSQTTDNSPQGNLSAFVTVSDEVGWIKSFTEHCVIIGLANVRADLSYQQGLPRMFSRRTRFDFYWPALANLGEQAVLNKEIYAQGTSADDEVFGYQERWSEYRYHPNVITGLFRSTAPQSLDYWHLAQKFESLPALNSEFINESVPIDRVVAVTDEPPVILDAYYDVKCVRPMPLYSIPSLGRRF